jgi:hypothetical protein
MEELDLLDRLPWGVTVFELENLLNSPLPKAGAGEGANIAVRKSHEVGQGRDAVEKDEFATDVVVQVRVMLEVIGRRVCGSAQTIMVAVMQIKQSFDASAFAIEKPGDFRFGFAVFV